MYVAYDVVAIFVGHMRYRMSQNLSYDNAHAAFEPLYTTTMAGEIYRAAAAELKAFVRIGRTTFVK